MKNPRLHTAHATAAYAVLQGSTWGFFAVVLVFSSNVLHDFGFSDSHVSLLLGIATGASCLMQLLVAELISRRPRLQISHMLLVLGGVILISMLCLLIPEVSSGLAVAAFAVACMAHQMIPSLANALGMDTIRRGAPTRFSISRGFGSVFFSLLSLLTGILVREFGIEAVYLLSAGLAVLLMVAVLWYEKAVSADLHTVVSESISEKKGGFLKQYPRFAVFLLGAILLCLSHNLMSTFLYQIMVWKHGGAAEQGIASAISALVELPPMFLFPLMMKKVRCDKWIRFAAVCMALKPLMILFSVNPEGVYLAQVTQMVGFGLYTIGSMNYAEMVVGKGESVRAQSYLGSTVTIGSLLALSSGGVICDLFGTQAMAVVSLISALLGGAVIVLFAQKTE